MEAPLVLCEPLTNRTARHGGSRARRPPRDRAEIRLRPTVVAGVYNNPSLVRSLIAPLTNLAGLQAPARSGTVDAERRAVCHIGARREMECPHILALHN